MSSDNHSSLYSHNPKPLTQVHILWRKELNNFIKFGPVFHLYACVYHICALFLPQKSCLKFVAGKIWKCYFLEYSVVSVLSQPLDSMTEDGNKEAHDKILTTVFMEYVIRVHWNVTALYSPLQAPLCDFLLNIETKISCDTISTSI